MPKLKLGVLISGRGSNLQALVNACSRPGFPAEIAIVISNKESAGGLEHARKAGIEAIPVNHKSHSDRASFDTAMTAELERRGVQLVCLAGFMRLLSDAFCMNWRDRLINIHPSLLPAFKGLDVQQAALDAGVRFSGCTVHYVRPEMDTGPIVIQAAVPVHADDTAATLAARILVEEHRIYPEAVRLIAEGRVRIENERAVVDHHSAPQNAQTNPLISE